MMIMMNSIVCSTFDISSLSLSLSLSFILILFVSLVDMKCIHGKSGGMKGDKLGQMMGENNQNLT